MAKHYVICKYCGIKFDRDAEPYIEVGGRRYAHKACAEEHLQNMTQEEKDETYFYEYAKQLLGTSYNYMMTKKLAEQYIKEYQYTYSGMQKALNWFYGIRKNPVDRANGSIGIIPYIYNEARDYYYRLWLAQNANNIDDVKKYKTEVIHIEIGSPRMKVDPPKLFNFGEDE